ncbi:MAG: hypothetical protein AAF228_13925, partial [Pseudomonadota bacterium]
IISQDKINSTLNTFADKWEGEGLEKIVTPILSPLYTTVGNDGKQIVDDYLLQLYDDQLGDVFFGDRNDALNQPLFDRAGITNIPPVGSGRGLAATFPSDIGIVPDADLDSYDKPLAIRPFKKSDDPIKNNKIFEGTGKQVNGENIMLIYVSGNSGSTINPGKRAFKYMKVNGEEAFVLVDPNNDYKPYENTDTNKVLGLTFQIKQEIGGEDKLNAYTIELPANLISRTTQTTLDITQSAGGLSILPKGYDFKKYKTLFDLDESKNVKYKESLLPITKGLRSVQLYGFDEIIQTGDEDEILLAPNALATLRPFIKRLETKKQSGDLITDGELQSLYYLIGNLDWSDTTQSSQLTAEEKIVILKIFESNPNVIFSNFTTRISRTLGTANHASEAFTSQIRQTVATMKTNFISKIEDDDTIRLALENWDSLDLQEKKRIIELTIKSVKSAYDINSDFEITFKDNFSGLAAYIHTNDEGEHEIVFNNEYVRASRAPQILNTISHELFHTWQNKFTDKKVYEPNTLSEGEKDYARFLEMGSIYEAKMQAYYESRGAEYSTIDYPTSIRESGAFAFGNAIGAHFAQQYEMYYAFSRFNYDAHYGFPELATKAKGNSISSAENQQLSMHEFLWSENVVYQLKFFVDPKDFAVKLGVFATNNRLIWSSPTLHDLNDGKINNIILKFDDSENLIATTYPQNNSPTDVRIFPDFQIPQNDVRKKSSRLHVTPEGELVHRFETTNRSDDHSTDPDPALLKNLGDTLLASHTLKSDQYLISENNEYQLVWEYDIDDDNYPISISIQPTSDDNDDVEPLEYIPSGPESAGKWGELFIDETGVYTVNGDPISVDADPADYRQYIIRMPANITIEGVTTFDATKLQLTLENDGELSLYYDTDTQLVEIDSFKPDWLD